MSEPRPHLEVLEEIERDCVPGLVEVLRTEGIEGVRYALWDMTGWHRDYSPAPWRSIATSPKIEAMLMILPRPVETMSSP